MKRALTTIGAFVVLAIISFVALNVVAGISDSAAPSATSGFNYGKSFTGPLARDRA